MQKKRLSCGFIRVQNQKAFQNWITNELLGSSLHLSFLQCSRIWLVLHLVSNISCWCTSFIDNFGASLLVSWWLVQPFRSINSRLAFWPNWALVDASFVPIINNTNMADCFAIEINLRLETLRFTTTRNKRAAIEVKDKAYCSAFNISRKPFREVAELSYFQTLNIIRNILIQREIILFEMMPTQFYHYSMSTAIEWMTWGWAFCNKKCSSYVISGSRGW